MLAYVYLCLSIYDIVVVLMHMSHIHTVGWFFLRWWDGVTKHLTLLKRKWVNWTLAEKKKVQSGIIDHLSMVWNQLKPIIQSSSRFFTFSFGGFTTRWQRFSRPQEGWEHERFVSWWTIAHSSSSLWPPNASRAKYLAGLMWIIAASNGGFLKWGYPICPC